MNNTIESYDVVLILSILLLLMLIIREFWAWYFKINKMIRLLEAIEENTRSLYKQELFTEIPKENGKTE